jgi:flagellar protein FlaG
VPFDASQKSLTAEDAKNRRKVRKENSSTRRIPKEQVAFFARNCYRRYTSYMNNPTQPNIKFSNTPDYRETYANSVQIRVNVWDFFLVFGTMQQVAENQVELRNFQGVYLSPQQAKALMSLLQQNVANYETAFGPIQLDPRAPGGPVH